MLNNSLGVVEPMPTRPSPFTPFITREGVELPVFPSQNDAVSVPCSIDSNPYGLVVPMPTLPLTVAKVAPADEVTKVVEAYVALSRFPFVKVRSLSSVNAPAVVRNGMRVVVSEETVRLVVLAVPETVMAVLLAYGKMLAIDEVAR